MTEKEEISIMAGLENRMFSKVEDIKQDQSAIRNILILVAALAYVGLLYISGLFMLLVTFELDSIGFFHVIYKTLTVIEEGKGLYAFLTILLLAVELFLVLAFRGLRPRSRPDFEYADNGNYGTSRFSSSEIYKEFLDLTESSAETDGIILGIDPDTKKVVSIPKTHPHNRNIFVCGSQGTSKSIAFSRTMVMQCAVRGESVFLTDPKGELYRDLALFLKFMGYKVYQWNLVNRWSSDGWDILQEVHGDEEYEYIDILVNTIIANTGGTDSGDFFDNIEGVLLKAVCLYVLAAYPEKDQNFASVYNLITSKSSEELDDMFTRLQAREDYAAKLAFGAYNLFAKSPTNKGNAILGLGARLSVFSTEVVQRMISQADIHVEDLGKRKTAIFCIASDTNTTYAVLNALLTSITFIKVLAYADRNGGHCAVPVHFILDEFVNIGQIPDFTKKLGTARSRDIGMTIIVQNMPQLENRYPNGQAEEIVGGCDFRVLLGANDGETAKYFSFLTGTATIRISTDRRSASTSPFSRGTMTPVEGVSEGSGQRTLIYADEILRMDTDQLLLIVRGEQPIRLDKYKYFYDPNALLLRTYEASSVIPGWAVNKKGVYLRTGEIVEETREEMEDRIMHDPSRFVVKDTEKWGPQRSDLIRSFFKIRRKYKNSGKFPNGMPLSIYDDFVLGGEVDDDPQAGNEGQENVKWEFRFRNDPHAKSSDSTGEAVGTETPVNQPKKASEQRKPEWQKHPDKTSLQPDPVQHVKVQSKKNPSGTPKSHTGTEGQRKPQATGKPSETQETGGMPNTANTQGSEREHKPPEPQAPRGTQKPGTSKKDDGIKGNVATPRKMGAIGTPPHKKGGDREEKKSKGIEYSKTYTAPRQETKQEEDDDPLGFLF